MLTRDLPQPTVLDSVTENPQDVRRLEFVFRWFFDCGAHAEMVRDLICYRKREIKKDQSDESLAFCWVVCW